MRAILPHRSEKIKQIGAGAAALVVLAGGTIGTVKLVKAHNNGPIEPETSYTSEVDTTEEELYVGNLVLTEDFDIKNEDEVRKRAQAIYDISDKKYSVDEIMNLIYYFNEEFDLIKFKSGSTPEDKHKYLKTLEIELYDLLFCNVQDDINRMMSITDEENKEDDVLADDDTEIYAYMFMAGGEGKGNAIALALEVDAQLDAIRDGNVESFEKNAENFYRNVEEINKLKLSKNGYMVLLQDDYKSKTGLYGKYISKEQSKLIETADTVYVESLFTDASRKVGANHDANIKNTATTTPMTRRVVATDKDDANKREVTTRKFEQPKKVDNGGKKVTTQTQVVQKPGTTRYETVTFVASTTKGEEVTFTTLVEKGGEVVSESYVYYDADDERKAAELEATTEPVTNVNKENYSEPSTEYDSQNESTTVYRDADAPIKLEDGGVPVVTR